MGMKTSKGYFLIAASVALLAFTGCGEKKQQQGSQETPANQMATPQPDQQGQGGMPSGHPQVDKGAEDITKMAHSTIKTQKEVKLSPEVKAKWKEVKMDLIDPASKKKETLTLKVGETTPLKNNVKIKVAAFVPDYAIADTTIESRSNEPKNPAVLLELFEGDKIVAKGWVFKDFPEFNSYNDARFPLILVAPGVDKPASPASAKK